MRAQYLKAEQSIELSSWLAQDKLCIVETPADTERCKLQITDLELFEYPGLCFSQNSNTPYGQSSPHFFSSLKQAPASFFLSILKTPTHFIGLLCLSYHGSFSELSLENDQLFVSAKNLKPTQPLLLAWRHTHLEELMLRLCQAALHLTHDQSRISKAKIPAWLSYLGWSSAIALGKNPDHAKVLDSIWGIQTSGFPLKYVVIDEGWAAPLEKGILVNFDADKERFPKGLKGLIKAIKHLGIELVGLYHPLALGEKGVQDNEETFVLGEDLGKTFAFYNKYYSYLQAQGVDFVRVGQQNLYALESYQKLDSQTPIGLCIENLQTAAASNANLHFSMASIQVEAVFNGNLFSYPKRQLLQCSLNFDAQDPQGAAKFIRNSLCSSLFVKHLMQPCFGPIHLSENSEALAIFGTLSSTTANLSSELDKLEASHLAKMILPNGKFTTCDQPLSLSTESLLVDPIKEAKAYKAYSCKGDNLIIAAFHLHEKNSPITDRVSPKETALYTPSNYAVFSYQNGYLGTCTGDESIEFTLNPHEADLFTFAPIEKGAALMGCPDYFLPSGPVNEFVFDKETLHIATELPINLLLYIEREILEIRQNGKLIPFDHDTRNKLLHLPLNTQLPPIPAFYTLELV